jgi:phosphoenolpyruvate carboxykinase (GTP)
MMKRREGVDIVVELGGIKTPEAVMRLFEEKLDTEHFSRLQRIKHPEVKLKIANAIAMCRPERVFINTGTESDRQFIRDLALERGEESKLPMPGHTIHYDLKEEQGRIIDRTFYFTNPGDLVSTLGNKIDRNVALKDVRDKMSGIMDGMTMIVGFYLRGPVGAPVSNPALEITSSAYVSHSAEIL